MPQDGPHRTVALVETSDALPGLLPFQAWDVLGTAPVVFVRDAGTHPSAPHLYMAGLDLVTLEPATLDRGDLDLSRPGSPEDRRLAKALVAQLDELESVVYLLGPDDAGLAPALAGMAAERDVEIELVLLAQQPAGTEFLRLVRVMRELRDPRSGCPWDLEQDHTSLTRYLVEESYELIDAIERGHDVDIQEELGDVLLQVVFHAQIASDRDAFGVDDVARGIAEKLLRRHPHVFGDAEVETAADVQANWDTLKATEKDRTGPFEGVPDALPGLHLLETLQRKAAKLGFDWDGPNAPRDRIGHELQELDGALSDAERTEELGDLLGAAVGLARQLGIDPDVAARTAASKFRGRVEAMLALARGRDLEISTLDRDAWLELWQEVKQTADRSPPAAGGET